MDEKDGKERCEEYGWYLPYTYGLHDDFYTRPWAIHNPGRIVYHEFSREASSCFKAEEDKILPSICG
ncbi:glycosyltransferase [Candidatus Brocadia sinica JPN1]|uniref:Glycosyltransferase n=1 Tax=Candidatus Brocadia sinica JPN1 TaxID=1197129 RepID=A0ABQ0K2G4_9BACT|nr:glycosyltransferase [Candidatus Brocadia sinica JPN1]